MFQPDYRNVVNTALNQKSAHIPLYEHSVSPHFMERIQREEFSSLAGKNYRDKVK
ncbi:MAG: hypothetical protein LBL70_05985 [Treponema sp.]|jgi:hypothetical protein|nr:hypothetical protein [Treponema sp.]